jgi:hypothetical protein
MLANLLKQRMQIQEKVIATGAMGQTVVWKFVQNVYGRKIPLDTKTIIAYQQLNTVVSYKIVLRGAVTINIGKHRIISGADTLEPKISAKHSEGVTEVLV